MTRTNIASKNQIIRSETFHIVIIGAGNVATHVSRHLYAQGHRIDCFWSRNPDSARELAREVGAKVAYSLSEVPEKADFYLVAVPDKAVLTVAADFAHCEGIWLHTAGSLSMDVFKGQYPEYGVLYPLQTLSLARRVRLGHIPFLVEGSSPEVSERVSTLASAISERVEFADSATRLKYHLAAVFANNFSNHLIHIAQKILEEHQLDPGMLEPLIEETFLKMGHMSAGDAQTGPAARDDAETMSRHTEMLKKHPEWEKLYTFISRDIERSRKE